MVGICAHRGGASDALFGRVADAAEGSWELLDKVGGG